ncbi:EAL domain-containing protein [Desulfitobacterium sp. Sab5]|uniref:EAL domain-containing protein n=1 Tax=Desulfitobacterium nosdiversum TaxID=3375356 RepID=UPI003CF4B7E2
MVYQNDHYSELKRFQGLIQESCDVFVIASPEAKIQYISPAVEKFLGYTPEEEIGKSIFNMFEDRERVKVVQSFQQALTDSSQIFTAEVTAQTRLGKSIYMELTVRNLLSDPFIQGIVINWRDVTEKVVDRQKIEYMAAYDRVTKLPNQNQLLQQLQLECERAKDKGTSFALMKVDIDGFKHVNNALGYQLGDQLLLQFAQRIRNFLSEEAFFSRSEGDLFRIIAPRLNSAEEYEQMAKDIIDLFSKPFTVDIYEIYLSITIGISLFAEDAQDPDTLLKYSYNALLQAKKEGKNKYVIFSSQVNIESYKQFMLRNDLHAALENEQFQVYYQPFIKLRTNEIIGAEALIRWKHPKWGMVSPGEFISLAEEIGVIVSLGNWVLREVCRNYRQWLNEGLPAMKISVNYSGIQLFEKDFVENILKTVAEFELDPHFLIVELTESILIHEFKSIKSSIRALQAVGIKVALDDFGTGYSSFAYLHRLKIDFLKIDCSFIRDIPLNNKSTLITKSIITLARDLGIKLVAEGVENAEQLSFLRYLNCYTGQGYFYSRPVPKIDFEQLLAKKICEPNYVSNLSKEQHEERREFSRIHFHQQLKADLTIFEFMGNKAKVGTTRVLIKDIGPEGLCFISDVRFPVAKDIVLKITTQLMGQEIKVYGSPVWTEESSNLYEYGFKFTVDENKQLLLHKVLNEYQSKLDMNSKVDMDGFVAESVNQYFSSGKNGIK